MDTGSPVFSTPEYPLLQSSVDPYLAYQSQSYNMSPISPLSQSSPRMGFGSLNPLNLGPFADQYPYSTSPSYVAGRADRFSPTDSISPPLTSLSAADLSSDSLNGRRSRASSGTSSPPSSHGSTLVHRHPLRHNASSSSVHMNGKDRKPRRKSDDSDDDDDDGDFQPKLNSSDMLIQKRREEIRRQRIESEQRRRDELRDGYRRLKEVLPVSNQKSSKVSLLDRATTHIRQLENSSSTLQARLTAAEMETQRLRQVNETLMLGAAEQRSAAVAAAAASNAASANQTGAF